MARRIGFRPRARGDLNRIYDFIDGFAGVASAWAAVERIEGRCRALVTFPNRGTPRPELHPGLRSVAAGKAVITYRVDAGAVVIVRIFYAGEQMRPEDFHE